MSYSSSGGHDDRTKPKAERPIDEVRFGRCKVVVWLNKTQNGDMLNFVPTRLYRGRGGVEGVELVRRRRAPALGRSAARGLSTGVFAQGVDRSAPLDVERPGSS